MDILLLDTSGHLADPLGGPDGLRAADEAPDASRGGVPAPPIYSPAGRAEVKRVIDWLAVHGNRARLFAWLPEVAEGQTDHFTDLVFEISREDRVLPICVVSLRSVNEALAERLFVRGLRRIIIQDDGAVPTADAVASVLRVRDYLENKRRGEDGRLRPMTPTDWYSLSLWLDESNLPGHFHRVREMNASGVAWEMISTAQMTVGAGGETAPELGDGYAVPAEGLSCRVYDSTIVIDSNLDVLPCPRFAGTTGTNAGQLYRDSPEELMVNKGRRAVFIGCTDLCATCGLGARFRWEQSRPTIVDEYVALGRREGALGERTVVPSQLDGRHIDLGAADPAQQAAELAAFEKSLDDWASSMEGLEDSPDDK